VSILLHLGLSNALMATGLAVLAAVVSSLVRRPAVAHSLWLLVLLKLLTPPLFNLPVAWPFSPVTMAKADAEPLHIEAGPEPTVPEGLPVAADADPSSSPPVRFGAGMQSLDEGVGAEEGPRPAAPPESAGADARMEGKQPNAEEPGSHATLSWTSLAAAAWLLGSALWLTLTALRIGRFYHLLGYARRAPEVVQEQVRRLARGMGLRHTPDVWIVPAQISPLLWAFGIRPRLLLPAALWERLEPRQQTTLLVHELAHLRRRDPWVRVLEMAALGLYWWHPVAWWACRELREAEEQCCDAWVVWALPRDARAYATALVETVDFLSGSGAVLPVAASGIGHVHDLRRRITMIMRGSTPRSLSVAGFLAVLALGAFLLPMLPSWAQPPGEEQQPPPGRDEQRRRSEDVRREREDGDRDEGIEQARRQVRELQAQVERMQSQLERNMERLREAQRRMEREVQRREARNREEGEPRRQPGQPVMMGRLQGAGAPGGMMEGPRGPRDPERRLSDMERKLDALLEEVRALRREVRLGTGQGAGRRGGAMGAGGGRGFGVGPGGLAPAVPPPPTMQPNPPGSLPPAAGPVGLSPTPVPPVARPPDADQAPEPGTAPLPPTPETPTAPARPARPAAPATPAAPAAKPTPARVSTPAPEPPSRP
jgi:beta-lactamase regulating signal transducer with metallopeptidase domain